MRRVEKGDGSDCDCDYVSSRKNSCEFIEALEARAAIIEDSNVEDESRDHSKFEGVTHEEDVSFCEHWEFRQFIFHEGI